MRRPAIGLRTPKSLLAGSLVLFLFPFRGLAGPIPPSPVGSPTACPFNPVGAYSVQIQTEYPPDSRRKPKRSVLLQKGWKTLWELRSETPFEKAIVSNETGRCFIEAAYPGRNEIWVFDRSGKKIMVQRGRLLAISARGRSMAYLPSGTGMGSGALTVQVVSPDNGQHSKFKLTEGFVLKALSDDGKTILVGKDELNLAGAEYRLVDEQGTVIWGKKGRGIYLCLEHDGQWVSFARLREKKVEICDFKTGRVLDEMPRWKYDAIHRPPPPPRETPQPG